MFTKLCGLLVQHWMVLINKNKKNEEDYFVNWFKLFCKTLVLNQYKVQLSTEPFLFFRYESENFSIQLLFPNKNMSINKSILTSSKTYCWQKVCSI